MTHDPQTGKEQDFKILHQQDMSLNNGPVNGAQPGARPNQLRNQSRITARRCRPFATGSGSNR